MADCVHQPVTGVTLCSIAYGDGKPQMCHLSPFQAEVCAMFDDGWVLLPPPPNPLEMTTP